MSEGELKDKVKKMYDEGKSIRQIAAEMGMTYSKVRKILIEQNVKFRGRVADETVKEIVERGKKGESANKISKEMNMNFNTVLRIMRKYNLVKRKRKLSQNETLKIKNDFVQGKSIYQIAKEMKISTNLVVYYLKKYGVYRPSTHELSPT